MMPLDALCITLLCGQIQFQVASSHFPPPLFSKTSIFSETEDRKHFYHIFSCRDINIAQYSILGMLLGSFFGNFRNLPFGSDLGHFRACFFGTFTWFLGHTFGCFITILSYLDLQSHKYWAVIG